jgi:hypothetical protein
MDVFQWALGADGNNAPTPHGAPEGWRWNAVNDTLREHQAAMARWYQDAEWLRLFEDPVSRSTDAIVRIQGTDLTALFIPDMRVRMLAGATFVDADVFGSVFSSGDTLVAIYNGEVPLGCDGLLVHSAADFGGTAFREIGSADDQVPLVEDIRPLTTGYAGSGILNPFTTPIIAGGVNVQWSTGDGWIEIPGADGETPYEVGMDLFIDRHTSNPGLWAEFILCVGTTGLPVFHDNAVYVAFVSPKLPSSSNIPYEQIYRFPNIPLGTPDAGDRLSILAAANVDDFVSLKGGLNSNVVFKRRL